jgi:hypothetical protein
MSARRARMRRLALLGRTGQTAVRWRVAAFVGTVFLVGACVQIAGIDDPHPKAVGEDAGQEPGQDAGQDADQDAGQDASQDADQDAGQDPVQDPEWANWPMPNPKNTTLPNLADYTPVTEMAMELVKDEITGLIWQRDIHPDKLVWAEAKKYCTDLVYGGHEDWRLPTAIELVSLVDFTIASSGPTIDMTAFPGALGDLYWTVSPLVGSSTEVWVVNFNTGGTSANTVAGMCRLRCVR